MNRGMIKVNTTLGHHRFDLATAQRISFLPANAGEHDGGRKMQALEYGAQRRTHHRELIKIHVIMIRDCVLRQNQANGGGS